MLLAAGFGVVGEKSRPAIVQAGGRHLRFPTYAEVDGQLPADAPIVLHIAGEVGQLLADEADGVELPLSA